MHTPGFFFPFFSFLLYEKHHSTNSTIVKWNLDKLNTGVARTVKGVSTGPSKE